MPWVKGQSGNPGGRTVISRDIRELARSHYAEAIEVLVQLMRHAEKEETRFRAAQDLADRGLCKPGPEQPVGDKPQISGSMAQYALEIHQRLLLAEKAAEGLVPEESDNVP